MLRSARASDPSRPSRASARMLSARCRRSSGVLALASASSSSSGSTTARSCCAFALRACSQITAAIKHIDEPDGQLADVGPGLPAGFADPGRIMPRSSHKPSVIGRLAGRRRARRAAQPARDTPVLSPPTSEVGVCCASRLAGLPACRLAGLPAWPGLTQPRRLSSRRRRSTAPWCQCARAGGRRARAWRARGARRPSPAERSARQAGDTAGPLLRSSSRWAC
jgi:hypothetical protein